MKKIKWNGFKITALVVIVLFVLIVAGGLVRWYHFRSSFTTLDATQIDSIKAIALQDLQSRGKNTSSYEVQVLPKMHRMDKDDASKTSSTLAQVSLRNQQEIEFYLIDLNSNKIVMRSETDYFDGFNTPEKNEGSRWFHHDLRMDFWMMGRGNEKQQKE